MRPHPPSRRRWQVGVLASIVAISMLSVSLSAASDAFSDVPTSHPFHDEIGWMASSEISTGFGDGTFRPLEPVSRQAMAAFMQRLFDLRDPVTTVSDSGQSHAWALDWTDFATASATVTVPPGTTALLLAEFTGLAVCYSGGPGDECRARMLVNGAEMSPTHVAGSYSLATNDDATTTSNAGEGHSIVRHHGPVGPGVYTITVQTEVSQMGTSFAITDWVLTAEAILQPSAATG